MKPMRKLLGFGANDPLGDSLASIDRLEAQLRKLDGRLAAAASYVDKVNADRRQELVEREPDAAEMGKLNKACADAAEARSGLEEAIRHVNAQLADAVATHAGHADATKRRTVIAECNRRAEAIDAAARRLVDAAQIFADARIELVDVIGKHGVFRPDPLSADGSGVKSAMIAQPIVMAAMRLAAPGGAAAAFRFAAPGMTVVDDVAGPALDNDAMVVVRRNQSGRLRDHAEDIALGLLPIEAPPLPSAAHTVAPVVMPAEALVVLRTGIAYRGANGRPVLIRAGAVQILSPVAEAALAAGMAARHGTAEAAKILQELAAAEARPATGLKSVKKVEPMFAPLAFDLGEWVEAQRATAERAA